MRKNGIFLVSILVTLLFWQWAYYEIKGHYSGLSDAKVKISNLQQLVKKNQLRTELTQYQFDIFKQQIALKIPQVFHQLDPMGRKEGRGIASLLQKPNEEFLTLAQFESEIEEMKLLFEKKKYQSVIRKGKMILEQNPISSSLVTVYFMLAESFYQINEFDSCFNIAEEMITLFPENPKTGYVLLRVGIFLNEKNKIEEARGMFALVKNAFSMDSDLQKKTINLLADLSSIEGKTE